MFTFAGYRRTGLGGLLAALSDHRFTANSSAVSSQPCSRAEHQPIGRICPVSTLYTNPPTRSFLK